MRSTGSVPWSLELVTILGLAAAGTLGLPPGAEAQGPPPAVREAVGALISTLESGDEESARFFVDQRLSDAYREQLGNGALEHVQSLQRATREAHGNAGLERVPDGMRLVLTGRERVVLQLDLDQETGRFDRVEVVEAEANGRGAPRSDMARSGERAERVDDHLMALELLGTSEESARAFMNQRMVPGLRANEAEMLETLAAVGRAVASAGMIGLNSAGPYEVLVLRGSGAETRVRVLVADAPPFLIEELTIESGVRDSEPARPVPWEELDAELERAKDEWGFSGTVLAVREGEVVLHEAYGLADREANRPNGLETIYDIGSQPIDFTRAAIWFLVERGALSMDDPITRFYPDAPGDKRDMTIRHLMEHQSGLPNFHHTAADQDWDLTWIDRAEAERRILARDLLFEPGTDVAPSHSAFGLLAAIVERASGQTYEGFLREHFFEPAGMTRTGPYGDDLGHPLEAFATGYGDYGVGEPNIPPHWGPTSWLIKGSGGMVSTPLDLYRFFDTIRSGGILTGEALEGYLTRGSSTGATDRGFLFIHAWAGENSRSMILWSQNAKPDDPQAIELRRRLAATVGARLGGG